MSELAGNDNQKKCVLSVCLNKSTDGTALILMLTPWVQQLINGQNISQYVMASI